jgi:hypothetical protein
MKSDEEKPEVQLAQLLVIHSSGHFGEPIVESSKERKKNAADDDVVEVRHHEIRICQLPIEWRAA